MNQSYSFLKKATFLIVSATFCSLVTKAQCGPIVQDFNPPAVNNMAGFSSSTLGSPDPGFTYGTNGGFGYLERCNIPNPATFIIVSPTYQSALSQTSIGVGFEFNGVVNASQVTIFIEYSNGSSIVSQQIAQVVPVYAANHATICVSTPISALPGYVAGMSYRVRMLIDAPAATNNNQCIQFDNFRTTGTDAQIGLPVSFTGISAKKAGLNTVLSWTVSGEKEVGYYVVEKSNDGRIFQGIAEIAATGKMNYSFTEKNAGKGVVYYRIRNVDQDGKFSYSIITKLNLDGATILNAWPQPVRSEVTIEHGLSQNGQITIAGATGQVVKTVKIKSGDVQTTINVGALQTGLYVVRFDDGLGEVSSIKVIKQ